MRRGSEGCGVLVAPGHLLNSMFLSKVIAALLTLSSVLHAAEDKLLPPCPIPAHLLDDAGLSSVRREINKVCSNPERFHHQSLSRVLQALINMSAFGAVDAFIHDDRFDMESVTAFAVEQDFPDVARLLIGELQKAGDEATLVRLFDLTVPRIGRRREVCLGGRNFGKMVKAWKHLLQFDYSPDHAEHLEHFILSYLMTSMTNSTSRLTIIKLMQECSSLPVQRKDRVMSVMWYDFIISLAKGSQDRCLTRILGTWPAFTERVNLARAPPGELPLFEVALKARNLRLMEMLSLNQDVFESIMSSEDEESTELALENLPQLKKCHTSTDPASRSFQAYVDMMIECPSKHHVLAMLPYQASPRLQKPDTLVLHGFQNQLTAPIFAAIEKGVFTDNHLNMLVCGEFF